MPVGIVAVSSLRRGVGEEAILTLRRAWLSLVLAMNAPIRQKAGRLIEGCRSVCTTKNVERAKCR